MKIILIFRIQIHANLIDDRLKDVETKALRKRASVSNSYRQLVRKQTILLRSIESTCLAVDLEHRESTVGRRRTTTLLE